jgi:hypothetical protein
VTPPIFKGTPAWNSCESQPKPMRGMRDMGEVDNVSTESVPPLKRLFI